MRALLTCREVGEKKIPYSNMVEENHALLGRVSISYGGASIRHGRRSGVFSDRLLQKILRSLDLSLKPGDCYYSFIGSLDRFVNGDVGF